MFRVYSVWCDMLPFFGHEDLRRGVDSMDDVFGAPPTGPR